MDVQKWKVEIGESGEVSEKSPVLGRTAPGPLFTCSTFHFPLRKEPAYDLLFLRQRQRDELWHGRAANRERDVLLAVQDVGHRRADGGAGQIDRSNLFACRLVAC